MSFIGGIKVTAEEFYSCWSKYDKDGNGFIEAGELDALLEDMVKRSNKSVNAEVLAEARAYYMGILDQNRDGKLDMNELSKLLVPEENFLLNFRWKNKQLTSVEFMQIWRKYDSDKNGYIEKGELMNFLHDLLTREGSKTEVPSVQRLEDYRKSILSKYDKNNDGRLDIKELFSLLPMEENFVARFKDTGVVTESAFDAIFDHYDQDKSGSIEGVELEGLLRDLQSTEKDVTPDDYKELKTYAEKILESLDTNNDGKLQKDELKMLFTKKK